MDSLPVQDAESDSREQLLDQMRSANEHLVLAALCAVELAAVAEGARQTAAYNEARFRTLAATAASVIWDADRDGVVQVEREGWLQFTGREPEGTSGWITAVHPDDLARVTAAWTAAVAQAVPYLCQHRLATRDGYSMVIARAAPIFEDGRVREWIGMMTDVSDRILLDEAKEQFIGILGHDLRNPLAAISLGAELFSELPEPYQRVAGQVQRSVRRMELMIRDLLDFTRGTLGGGIPVTPGPCNLGVLAREVTAEIRQAHPKRDIACEVSGVLTGECDTARVEQVFSNLLGNAVAHGEDPIRLTVQGIGDHVLISVRNRGTPIAADALPGLFEPFRRGPRTRSHGLGLGLYIVRQIVTAHGGSIEVTSSARDGTEVAIRWPRCAAGCAI